MYRMDDIFICMQFRQTRLVSSFLELVVIHQAAVFHFWISVLEQILRPFDDYLLIIYFLASESIKAFTIRVFICLLSLHDGSFNITK